MRRFIVALIALIAVLVAYPAGAAAHHGELPSEVEQLLGESTAAEPQPGDPMYTADDQHTANMSLIANVQYPEGGDLAFQGSTVVAGAYGQPGGFRLIDASTPAAPKLVGLFNCPGPQNDVSVWGDLVFVSVDSPRSSPECGAGGASTPNVLAGNTQSAWEGLRVVSIADPEHPRQVAAVYTDCGSHTHTLVPDRANGRLLVYIQSYPLSPQGARCNPATHRKISVVEVPLSDPAAARVVSTPNVGRVIGCHDTTVLLPRKLAAAACITQSQIWALGPIDGVARSQGASLENPKVIAEIDNPRMNIHHSSAFSWDGKTLVLGDEFAGAAEKSPCTGAGADHLPLGALWFYDVTDPDAPREQSFYRIPEVPMPRCGAHNFNPVPLSTGRDILVSGWYEGGTGVIDFTDPETPERLGYYIPRAPQAESWSSYWYNGHIYANNFTNGRGLDVLTFTHPALRAARELDRLNPQTQTFLIPDRKRGR
jgi:hypothetical protein